MFITDQKSLYDLKREISVSSKKNFALERDIRTLDKKIALLIKNRISLEVFDTGGGGGGGGVVLSCCGGCGGVVVVLWCAVHEYSMVVLFSNLLF